MSVIDIIYNETVVHTAITIRLVFEKLRHRNPWTNKWGIKQSHYEWSQDRNEFFFAINIFVLAILCLQQLNYYHYFFCEQRFPFVCFYVVSFYRMLAPSFLSLNEIIHCTNIVMLNVSTAYCLFSASLASVYGTGSCTRSLVIVHEFISKCQALKYFILHCWCMPHCTITHSISCGEKNT